MQLPALEVKTRLPMGRETRRSWFRPKGSAQLGGAGVIGSRQSSLSPLSPSSRHSTSLGNKLTHKMSLKLSRKLSSANPSPSSIRPSQSGVMNTPKQRPKLSDTIHSVYGEMIELLNSEENDEQGLDEEGVGPSGNSGGGAGGGPGSGSSSRRGRGESHIVAKFWEFHNTRLNHFFVASLLTFFRSHMEVEALLRDPNRDETRLAAVQRAKAANLVEFSRMYARVVLFCSNYEDTKMDERFFENLYLFMKLILYRFVEEHQRDSVDSAIEYVFRGHLFTSSHFQSLANTKVIQARKVAVREPTASSKASSTTLDKSASGAVGAGKSIKGNDDVSGVPRTTINGSVSTISYNQHSRTAEPTKKKTSMRPIRCRTRVNPVVPAKQTSDSLGLRFWAPGATKSKSPRAANRISIHTAIHARSPLISLILPTPKERYHQALINLRAQQKQKPHRRRGVSPRVRNMKQVNSAARISNAGRRQGPTLASN